MPTLRVESLKRSAASSSITCSRIPTITSLRFSPAGRARPAGEDVLHDKAGRPRQAEARGEVGSHPLHADAQPRPHDAAALGAGRAIIRSTMLEGVAKPMPTEPPLCE